MNYDSLSSTYRSEIQGRIEDLRKQIAARGECVTTGRVVPTDTDQALGVARRLKVAVMFLDICGFSSRAASTVKDQDMMVRTLHLFFSEMVRIAEEYGGTVEKNTGDGLMAYFEDQGGDPPETGCKRAVACALTQMLVNEQYINPILRNSSVAPIDFRIGIDYGNVAIAQLGAAKRFNSVVAVGTTANIACKMLAKADKNEILIGEDVFSALPEAWRKDWCTLKTADSGWVYKPSDQSYRFFKYIGRWNTTT